MFSLYENLATKLAPHIQDERKSEVDRIEKARQARLAGLGRMRSVSTGQIRRADRRYQAAQARKTNRRYHRSWFANQHAIARLRGQLVTVAAIPTEQGKYLVGQSPALMKNAFEQLERAYGSVDAATEHYESVVTAR